MNWIEKLRTAIGATQGDVTVALFAALTALVGLIYTTFFDNRSPAEQGRELRLLAIRHDSIAFALRGARLRAVSRNFGSGVPVPELALFPLDSIEFDAVAEELAGAPPATSATPLRNELEEEGEVSGSTPDTLLLGSNPAAPSLAERMEQGPPRTPLDLNSAPLDQLERLPGVGEVLATRIVEYRRRSRFVRVDDVMKVKGIGEVKLAKMRPYITVR